MILSNHDNFHNEKTHVEHYVQGQKFSVFLLAEVSL